MLTTLAIIFVLLLVGSVFYGFGLIMRRPPTEEELRTEKCSICRDRFPKEDLVERTIGDYKVFYFCANCINNLHTDMQEKDTPSSMNAKRLLSDVQDKRN